MVNLYLSMKLDERQEEELAKVERLRDSRFEWRDKKMRNIKLAHLYDVAGLKEKGDQAASCTTWIRFIVDGQGVRKLDAANFCQLRLCPICTARRAMKNAYRLNRVMNLTEFRHRVKFLFLTLTVENCEGDKLGETLSLLTKAWDRLMKQRPIARACKGWYRAIEITYSRELGYHPHIHAIIAVELCYFKRSSGQYITQADWVARWQKAARLPYKPIIHIQKTKDGKGGQGAVLEASKYATKDSEYIDPRLDEKEAAGIVATYTKALHKRRLTAYGGVMKEIAVQVGADKEDDDLVHVDGETIRADLAEMIEYYGWHFGAGDYILSSRQNNPLKVVRKDGGN